jgi:hypothetical protein
MLTRIRTLSMPSPTRAEREAGRDLDRCWRQGLQRKAPASGDPLTGAAVVWRDFIKPPHRCF